MCCEGWLSADIKDKTMHRGKPCHYVCETGCTIYSDRPQLCKDFKCNWLQEEFLPHWFRPDLCDFICKTNHWNDGDAYLTIVTGKNDIEMKYVRWLWESGINFVIVYNDRSTPFGIPDFINWYLGKKIEEASGAS